MFKVLGKSLLLSFNGVLLILLCIIASNNAIELDNTGSYDLVVAIDERTAQNSIENYVANIKSSIQDLSDLLHFTTEGKFSIRKADILVPTHWNTETDGIATNQYFEGADIKISHVHSLPYVNNPNPCGMPGTDIILPYNFFNDTQLGDYGWLGKALLTQFVRLRFGAWEEHGYPGDSLFPYYWKPLASDDWQINACTDAPIEGTYKNIDNGQECGTDPEDVDHLYPPPGNCRFIPSDTQTAKSSIMSYHYLQSFENFCDASTHNKEAPTPQNYYCRYKSVMEVIKGTADWKQATQQNPVGRVDIKVVKNANAPLLYVLLDGGISQAPVTILTEISTQLKDLFNAKELRNLIAGVGRFPADVETDAFTELVPWSPIRTNLSEFEAAFDDGFGSKSGFRNYAGSLKEIIGNIKNRKHKQGAAILVVKTGAETNTGALAPEGEVIADVLDTNIKIFAIEIQGNEIQPGIALKNLIEKSEGAHLALANINDLEGPLTDFFDNLKVVLQDEIKVERKYVLAMKEIVENKGVLLPFKGIYQFHVYAIPLSGEVSNVELASVTDGNYPDISLKEMNEWDASAPSKKIFSNVVEWNAGITDDIYWDQFSYTCGSGNCKVLLLIIVGLNDPSTVPSDITLSVSTSAINNQVDLAVSNADTDLGTAFAIYAKVEQDGVPLLSIPGLTVTAMIYLPDHSACWTLELKDDSKSIPDVSVNDGIFSGTFIPSVDGFHQIFVTVKYREPKPEPSSTTQASLYWNDIPNMLSGSSGKLFPVNQEHIGCGSGFLGCWSKAPDVEFVLSKEITTAIEFKNLQQFIPLVYRIKDLVITPLSDTQLNLQWTDPGVQTSQGLYQADFYEIKLRDDLDLLLTDFDKSENLPANKLPYPRPPGQRQNVTYNFGMPAKRFFAIRTITTLDPTFSLSPVISTVASVVVKEGDIISTTTTTIKTTIRPTTKTTIMPTTLPATGSTTDEDEITTERISRTTQQRTTPKTTTPPSTTRPPTTRPPPTTTKAPIKHWYQKKEGVITLSVFGGALLLLFSGGLTFIYFKNR